MLRFACAETVHLRRVTLRARRFRAVLFRQLSISRISFSEASRKLTDLATLERGEISSRRYDVGVWNGGNYAFDGERIKTLITLDFTRVLYATARTLISTGAHAGGRRCALLSRAKLPASMRFVVSSIERVFASALSNEVMRSETDETIHRYGTQSHLHTVTGRTGSEQALSAGKPLCVPQP